MLHPNWEKGQFKVEIPKDAISRRVNRSGNMSLEVSKDLLSKGHRAPFLLEK